ncbi:MAG: hypothetical protein WKF87_21125 [Chryseolinea sp.]
MREKDKVVAPIYETYDYGKFSIYPENRGLRETGGIKERKVNKLQKLIDESKWVHELGTIQVNESYQIINGAHTYTVLMRNKQPIRYIIIEDPRFNEATKREVIGSIYNINSINTAWSSEDMFNAAIQVKAPLALAMQALILKHNNKFKWLELAALLKKDVDFFSGRWRKVDMTFFDEKDMVEMIHSEEFKYDLKHFLTINEKARISHRKSLLLRCTYDIVFNARSIVDLKLFRKALASIPDDMVLSAKYKNKDAAILMLIRHYNKSQGQSVEPSAVKHQLQHGVDSEVEVM